MKKNITRMVSLVLMISIFVSSFIMGMLSVGAVLNTLITTASVRLRSSASITSDNILATLSDKETLNLLANSSDGWAYVSRKDGTKGYCSLDYLAVPSGSDAKIGGVTTSEVNFRKGPSTENDSIKLLTKGTAFKVVNNTDEYWIKADVSGTVGYIYRSYTKLSVTMGVSEDFVPQDKPDTPDWFSSSALGELLDKNINPDSNVHFALSESELTIEHGSKYALSAHTLYGTPVGSAVIYRSSDTSVATVTANGVVKGVSPGEAQITAILEDTDITAVCNVTVEESDTEPPEDDLVLSALDATIYSGNVYQIIANIPVSWTSSDTSVATVKDGFVTAKSSGTVKITASTKFQTASCTIKVLATPAGITIDSTTATLTEGKTYYNGVSGSGTFKWTSSDPSVAIVENGFITGISEGKAVVTVSSSKGARTCVVTVKPAEPVRFTYSAPNTVAPDEKVTLYAVTDKSRTAVKFDVKVGTKTVSVEATEKISDGNTYIWSGTTSISAAGTYSVTAYAKKQGEWHTCSVYKEDAETTIFVRKTADLDKETMEYRRVTDELIDLIASFEGYSSSVYFDKIANNIPTIGYGKVIYLGDSFYNDMTKREAHAYLVQTVNNDGYTKSVNSYLDKYSIYRNQQQFDALVSFVYNLGANILAGDSDFHDVFTAPAQTDGAKDTDAYINSSDVNFRESATTSSKVLGVLSYGTVLTLIEKEPENNWYHVRTESGTEGYVYADYVSKGKLSTSDKHYLSKINKNDFSQLLMQYHHAGSSCVWGLLYRRVDELDVFFYGEYKRNGSDNINGFTYRCSVNSSTTLD